LIQTGLFPEEGWGDEDVACADALEALLTGKTLHPAEIAHRVRNSRSGGHYDGTRPSFPPSDIDYALQFDRFSFAMLVTKKDGLHLMRAVPV
jgi:2-phosphosulfolactate phosphatase